jgi:hypothetical protein
MPVCSGYPVYLQWNGDAIGTPGAKGRNYIAQKDEDVTAPGREHGTYFNHLTNCPPWNFEFQWDVETSFRYREDFAEFFSESFGEAGAVVLAQSANRSGNNAIRTMVDSDTTAGS